MTRWRRVAQVGGLRAALAIGLLQPCPVFAQAARPAASSRPLRVPVFQKGFSFASWTADGYLSASSDEGLAMLHGGGVRWVSIVTLWQQQTKTSTVIAPHPKWTPTDDSLRHVIGRAHALGLKVMLKPQIDLATPGWRGDIALNTETDWSSWFSSYRAFIAHHAELAAKERVELLCVGVELEGTRHREAEWREVIASVRKVFRGPLTYAANWTGETDIAWWDALNYAGVDAYYPLVGRAGCTVEELKAGWHKHRQRLREWQARIKKPILFTEIGYRSTIRAAIEPWEWERPAEVSLDEQARLYQATLETFWDEPWFAGAYWWLWEVRPPADPANDGGYSIRGKPAWEVLKAHYAKPR